MNESLRDAYSRGTRHVRSLCRFFLWVVLYLLDNKPVCHNQLDDQTGVLRERASQPEGTGIQRRETGDGREAGRQAGRQGRRREGKGKRKGKEKKERKKRLEGVHTTNDVCTHTRPKKKKKEVEMRRRQQTMRCDAPVIRLSYLRRTRDARTTDGRETQRYAHAHAHAHAHDFL